MPTLPALMPTLPALMPTLLALMLASRTCKTPLLSSLLVLMRN